MSRRAHCVRWLAAMAGALGLCGIGCSQDPISAAEVRASFGEFSDAQLLELGPVRADLEILLDNDDPAVASVLTDDGSSVDVQSPVPMRCAGTNCSVAFTLPPGSYRFTLNLYGTDRCGRESLVGAFRPTQEGAIGMVSWQVSNLDFTRARFDFDDDGDGIINALELQVCGRTDVDERDGAPSGCVDEENPCCHDATTAAPAARAQAWGSDLIGRHARFPGGDWPGLDNATAPLAPFSLDATEVTWGQLQRCVAAGACVFDDGHPVRDAVVSKPRHQPATGLTPQEAATYCAWAGKRLPTDNEWDFAAAARENAPGQRAPYPFDLPLHQLDDPLVDVPAEVPEDVGDLRLDCIEGAGRVALNHYRDGDPVGCPLQPTSVGSYPSSHARRGVGAPLADLAGNVWEWTLPSEVSVDPTDTSPFPGGLNAAFIRGGHYLASPLLLNNNFNRLRVATPDEVTRLTRSNQGEVGDVVGFRCAWSDDADVALEEPVCAAP